MDLEEKYSYRNGLAELCAYVESAEENDMPMKPKAIRNILNKYNVDFNEMVQVYHKNYEEAYYGKE